MVMRKDWIVGDTAIGDEESPASPVTVVLITAMENIAVEEEGITCLHLHLNQGKYLLGDGKKKKLWWSCFLSALGNLV